jgi:hypothetical protein
VEKLIKYIPGEVVAAFAGAALLAGRVPEWNPSIAVKVLFVCFLIATPIYFWSQSRSRPVEDRPVGFFYVLSMVAFFCWALGVSDQARQSIGTSAQLAEFLLAFGAFFVPAFDTWLTALVVPTTKTS